MASGTFQETQKAVELLQAAINELKLSVASLNEETKKVASTQENLKKKTVEVQTADQKLNDIEQQRIKLINDLNKANSTAIDKNEVLKVQLSNQRKINKEFAKEKLGLIGAYEKESKKLNELRKQYKNLAVQNKENTKEGKALLKNIQGLDKKLKDVDGSVGQNQRGVGNYFKSFAKSIAASGAAFFGVQAIIKGIGSAIKSTVNSTQTLGDKWTATTTQMKAGTELFFRSLATGNFNNFFKRLKEITAQAKEYALVMDRLGDLNRSLSVEQSKANIKLKELEVIYKDTSKTETERKDALNDYLKIQKELAQKSVDYAKLEYDQVSSKAALQLELTIEETRALAESYDTQEQILVVGEKYNKLIAQKVDLEAKLKSTMGGPTYYEFYGKKLEEVNKQLVDLGENADIAGKIQIGYQKSNDDLLNNVAESAKKYYDAQSSFNENTIRAQTTLGSLNKELADQEIKSEAEVTANKEKELAEENVKTVKLKEFEKIDTYEKTNDFINNLIESQIEEMNKLSDTELEQAYQQADAIIAARQYQADEEIRIAQEAAEKEAIAKQGLKDVSVDIANQGFAYYQALQDRQLDILDERLANEEISEKKYAKEKAKIQRKQAIAEKAQGIFNAIISTAQGIAAALELGPFGIPLSILIGTLGGVQIATIAAQKLPSIPGFQFGTQGALKQDTLANVSEAGSELLVTKEGDMFKTPKTKTTMWIPEGSRVFSANSPETKLAFSGGMTPEQYEGLIREQQETRKAIVKNSQKSTFDSQGTKIVIDQSGNRKKYIDHYIR